MAPSGAFGRRRLGVHVLRCPATVALMALVTACGYQAVYADGAGERLHVKVVRNLVVDAVAADEVAAGVRDELATGGWLEAGETFPRVEVEVLRGDEASEGIGVDVARTGPAARSTDVGLSARAWIVRSAGAAPERDTGDMRAEDTVAVDMTAGVENPTADAIHHADALRAAARRLGRMLAKRLVGAPGPSEDGVPARGRGMVRSTLPP